MPAINKLSQTSIDSKAKKQKGKYSDGGGLYLHVRETGGKRTWRADYSLSVQQEDGTLDVKRKTIVLGSVDDHKRISLEEARKLRDTAFRLVSRGIDPIEYRKRIGHLNSDSDNDGRAFKFHAQEWLVKKQGELTPEYYNTFKFRVDEYVLPILGDMNLSDITAITIREAVANPHIRAGHYDLARRLVKIVEAVFNRAASFDMYRGNNPATPILEDMPKKPKPTHYPALTDPRELGQLLVDLDSYRGDPAVIGCAQLSILTALRAAELRFLKWEEVKFEKGIIHISIGRMKEKNREHKVPLSTQAVEILRLLESLNRHKSEFVFANRRNRSGVISENSTGKCFKNAGGAGKWEGRHTPHGCRKSFRTIGADECAFAEDLLEHSLHHLVKWPNGTAYAVNDKLAERFDIMQEWADYLDELKRKTLAGEPILTRAEIAYKKRLEEAAA